MEIDLLKELLYSSWSKDTCSPSLKDEWHVKNPSLGQCAITSLIVNDIFGGKIMRCMTSSGSHYYNMIENQIVDLTVEQFKGRIPDYEKGEERTREYLLSNEDTNRRYKKLLIEVRHCLLDKDFKCICLNEQLNQYKEYFNNLYMFCAYDLDNYCSDNEFEYLRIILEAQNTGTFIYARHNLETDEYSCATELKNFRVPTEFLKIAFEVAKKYKSNLKLEKKLQDAYTNI